jgi:hypothetical protein
LTRTFLHSFDPPAASPVAGPTVDLDVPDIEDAGIREVLQTPGTAYGAWSILDALQTPSGTGTPFIFKEPLRQAREVKVALSGLFGRFVARARASLQSLDLRPSTLWSHCTWMWTSSGARTMRSHGRPAADVF